MFISKNTTGFSVAIMFVYMIRMNEGSMVGSRVVGESRRQQVGSLY